MDMRIRNEMEKDFRSVEELTREAFWNLHVPGCDEHYLAHLMRNHPDFIKELDFVAEHEGQIIGNIMYTKAWLVDETGQTMEIASFGPVSVLPAYQRKGVGSALIQHTLALALQKGVKGIVIFGHPNDYCKHGFQCAKDFNISGLDGDYPAGMLALELQPGAFGGRAWKFKYSDVYHVDPAAAEAFDKTFPPKEKGYRYTQEIFSIASRSVIK